MRLFTLTMEMWNSGSSEWNLLPHFHSRRHDSHRLPYAKIVHPFLNLRPPLIPSHSA